MHIYNVTRSSTYVKHDIKLALSFTITWLWELILISLIFRTSSLPNFSGLIIRSNSASTNLENYNNNIKSNNLITSCNNIVYSSNNKLINNSSNVINSDNIITLNNVLNCHNINNKNSNNNDLSSDTNNLLNILQCHSPTTTIKPPPPNYDEATKQLKETVSILLFCFSLCFFFSVLRKYSVGKLK